MHQKAPHAELEAMTHALEDRDKLLLTRTNHLIHVNAIKKGHMMWCPLTYGGGCGSALTN